MRAKVTAAGLLIPKELLGDLDEVEILGENGCVCIMPAMDGVTLDFAPISPNDYDPINDWGSNPISMGIPDASVNHDRYIYHGLVPPIEEDMSVDFPPIIADDDDPIYELGKNPSKLGITDASVNHDRYIYP